MRFEVLEHQRSVHARQTALGVQVQVHYEERLAESLPQFGRQINEFPVTGQVKIGFGFLAGSVDGAKRHAMFPKSRQEGQYNLRQRMPVDQTQARPGADYSAILSP
jgi:hypothetical protein